MISDFMNSPNRVFAMINAATDPKSMDLIVLLIWPKICEDHPYCLILSVYHVGKLYRMEAESDSSSSQVVSK